MLLQAIKEALTFSALIVGMVGVPALVWFYCDWYFGWGWIFDRR